MNKIVIINHKLYQTNKKITPHWYTLLIKIDNYCGLNDLVELGTPFEPIILLFHSLGLLVIL